MSHVFLQTHMIIFYPATFHVDRATGIKMEWDRYGSNFFDDQGERPTLDHEFLEGKRLDILPIITSMDAKL